MEETDNESEDGDIETNSNVILPAMSAFPTHHNVCSALFKRCVLVKLLTVTHKLDDSCYCSVSYLLRACITTHPSPLGSSQPPHPKSVAPHLLVDGVIKGGQQFSHLTFPTAIIVTLFSVLCY